ncbi:T9SS C-terminal target domain-containing protein [Sphingobacteriales bacterium UPWRP_1]|nr:hypothetical protein BVG80_12925 [Sphingobacteriales bacterium TSM_CSM]PSJ75789.1 T9SS C-terminal target domain-containing protein [Sphingobacteriales bacterium UPWRP_1]
MKKLTYLLVVLSLLPFNTMRAQDVPGTAEEIIALLNGEWHWQYSVGSFPMDTFTTEEYGPGTFTFSPSASGTADSVNYSFTSAAVPFSSGTTALQNTPEGWTIMLNMEIGSGFFWYLNRLNNTELLFLDGAMAVDGPYAHYFTRPSACDQVNPTITGNLLVNCPYETSTLSTQTFDSYQWYRRGYFDAVAQPIAGATGQTYTATFDDVLYYLSVEVTQDTCTVTSPEVLIDQLIGLPPYVANGGNFTIDPNGNAIICPGDTLLLTAYSIAQFQWYNNGEPVGTLNQNPLPVTESGNYTVVGVDPICPLYPASLGLEIPVIAGFTPLIALANSGIEVINPYTFNTYQWYFNGAPIAGANSYYYEFQGIEIGTFWVVTTDVHGCTAQSAPLDVTGTGIENGGHRNEVACMVNAESKTLFITGLQNPDACTAALYDTNGRLVLQTALQENAVLHLGQLPAGIYICRIHNGINVLAQQRIALLR